jgi:nucleoid DNA-binding protein
MGRSLRFTEYIKKVANRSRLSEKSVRRVYDAMFEIVSEELRFTDEIRLKRFGTFYTVQKGGVDKRIPNPDGSYSVRYIEPYQGVRFKPSGEFKNYINGKLIDKESKRRERNNRLTKNEKKLLRYKTDDKDRNLMLAIEKLSKE